ncbi:MAG: glycoside hydrolase family 57 protein [Candidatus Saccharimonadales bacterium]
MKSILLYMHVHQPYRLRHYTIFDSGVNHNYFDAPWDTNENNKRVLLKVAEKSYLPTNERLLKLLKKYPNFKLSLSMSGVLLEQLEAWAPEALKSFQELTDTGRVELVAETYHHTLAFFYSRSEFEVQVSMHKDIIKRLFNQEPKVFRNTELAYNNELASWANDAGYKGILAEGWHEMLGWRSPNYLYKPVKTSDIKLLLKNYRLSDDIAFRFGDHDWSEWPLTADKFTHWLNEDQEASIVNLFMDYETFGEHQWQESGIFDFLEHLPKQWLADKQHNFMTVSEAVEKIEVVGEIDCPSTITWADTERDLSAWLGNAMQQQAIESLYKLEQPMLGLNDWSIIDDWRKLQTSDHFYYMCIKWFNDGDIHAYFSPYDSPYEAYLNFMNAYHDLKSRLLDRGVQV